MGTSPNTIPDNNGSTIILYVGGFAADGQAFGPKGPNFGKPNGLWPKLGLRPNYNNSIKNCQIFILKKGKAPIRPKSKAATYSRCLENLKIFWVWRESNPRPYGS